MKTRGVDDIQAALVRLRRAAIATRRVLFGNLAGSPLAAVVRPDLEALRPKLVQLSEALQFNCIEMAAILACQPKFVPEPTPVESAARSLLRASRGVRALTMFDSTGLTAIRAAVDAGNVSFFVKLGEHLRHLRGRKSSKHELMNLSLLRFNLVSWWKPDGHWPGLAYCTTSAIADALALFAGAGRMEPEAFERFWGNDPKALTKNLDRTLRQLNLVQSQHPIISRIEADRDAGSTKHLVFS